MDRRWEGVRVGGCERREGRLKDKGKRIKDRHSANGAGHEVIWLGSWDAWRPGSQRLTAYGARQKENREARA